MRAAVFACAAAAAAAFPLRAADAGDPARLPDGQVADEARIEEIARHLPDRPAWPLDLPKPDAKALKGALASPLPDCSDACSKRSWETDNGRSFQSNYMRRHRNLRTCAAAVAANGDPAALAKATEILEALLAENHWSLFGRQFPEGTWLDLGSSELIRIVVESLVQMKGRLDPELDRRVRADLERRAFALYRNIRSKTDANAELLKRNWWFYAVNNWSAFCHGHLMPAVLATVEDRRDRAAFIEAAERAMSAYLSGFGSDGYCSEGLGYWNYGMGPYLGLIEAVRAATGGAVDLARDPRARKAMSFGYAFRLDRTHGPSFADGGGGEPSPSVLARGARIWPEFAPRIEGELPKRDYFPASQVYIGRGRRMAIGLKGGHNGELHNHNDVGSWTLVADGVEIAGEPGPENYTTNTFSARRYESKIINSFGHPVPVVGGRLQATGRTYGAKTERAAFTDGKDVVAFDVTGAYPGEKDFSLVRRLEFDFVRDRLTIGDVFTTSRAQTFESVFTCFGTAEIAPDGRSLTVRHEEKGRQASLGVSVGVRTEPATPWRLVREPIDNPGRPTVQRVRVALDAPVSSARVAWRVVPSTR